ncbi:hypothetical protein CG435_07305 [Pantoea ananatis]|nr:hypothetical protein CG435_07305 [Pantoea ananatis]
MAVAWCVARHATEAAIFQRCIRRAENLNQPIHRIMTMQIDDADFPVVWIKMNAPGKDSAAPAFSEFEALLARKIPFVLLSGEGFTESKHEHSADEMKMTTRWMKAHKNELKAFVKASILIEPNTVKRAAARPFAIIYEKFWGYPLLMAASKEEALATAKTLL